MSPIPFEAIDRYADRFGIEDFDEFKELIRAADGAFMSEIEKRHEKKRETGGGNGSAPGNRGRRSRRTSRPGPSG